MCTTVCHISRSSLAGPAMRLYERWSTLPCDAQASVLLKCCIKHCIGIMKTSFCTLHFCSVD